MMPTLNSNQRLVKIPRKMGFGLLGAIFGAFIGVFSTPITMARSGYRSPFWLIGAGIGFAIGAIFGIPYGLLRGFSRGFSYPCKDEIKRLPKDMFGDTEKLRRGALQPLMKEISDEYALKKAQKYLKYYKLLDESKSLTKEEFNALVYQNPLYEHYMNAIAIANSKMEYDFRGRQEFVDLKLYGRAVRSKPTRGSMYTDSYTGSFFKAKEFFKAKDELVTSQREDAVKRAMAEQCEHDEFNVEMSSPLN